MRDVDTSSSRLERRKQRTRAALIRAAQDFIADGKLHVPVQEISEAADVGVGSFYNHFETKEELFRVAINEVLDGHGALLDALTDSMEDPAEKFAARFRLTGRLNRLRPRESGIALAVGLELIHSDQGLAPRGIRDIEVAAEAGRFEVTDAALANVSAAGALLSLSQLLHDKPERDCEETTDEVVEGVLRLFGMSEQEAHRISHAPLPDISWLADTDYEAGTGTGTGTGTDASASASADA